MASFSFCPARSVVKRDGFGFASAPDLEFSSLKRSWIPMKPSKAKAMWFGSSAGLLKKQPPRAVNGYKGGAMGGPENSYKIFLVDRDYYTEKMVLEKLPIAVPVLSQEEARAIYMECRQKGRAVVAVVPIVEGLVYMLNALKTGLWLRMYPSALG